MRFSVYVFWLSVLSLNNLQVLKAQKSSEKHLYTRKNYTSVDLLIIKITSKQLQVSNHIENVSSRRRPNDFQFLDVTMLKQTESFAADILVIFVRFVVPSFAFNKVRHDILNIKYRDIVLCVNQ